MAGLELGLLFADSLGEDAVDLSFGRQDFDLGSGFLIWEGATNGGNRGAYWLAPREAFEMTGIAKLETHGFIGRAFYLEPDDDPDTETKLLGLDVEYALAEGGCAADAYPANCAPLGYYNIVSSDTDTRDGMNVFDVRADTRPLTSLSGLRLAGEFAYEKNGSDLEAYGWYGEIGYAADDLPWSPYLSYRYAFFSGDEASTSGKSESFDPLFYDGPDWGIWTQGEILGEWVLANSNLISHTIRLNAYPDRQADADRALLLFPSRRSGRGRRRRSRLLAGVQPDRRLCRERQSERGPRGRRLGPRGCGQAVHGRRRHLVRADRLRDGDVLGSGLIGARGSVRFTSIAERILRAGRSWSPSLRGTPSLHAFGSLRRFCGGLARNIGFRFPLPQMS